MAPRFSVIITTYGRAAFLAEALDRCAQQSFADFECLVVDDASPAPPELAVGRPALPARAPHHVNGGAGRGAQHRYRRPRLGNVRRLPRRRRHLDAEPPRSTPPAAHRRRAGCGLRPGTLGSNAPRRAGPRSRRRRARHHPRRHDAALRRHQCRTRGHADVRRALRRGSEDVDWWLRTRAQVRASPPTSEVGLLYRAPRRTRARRTDRRGPHPRCGLLLADHAAWFATHPHAHAFRLKRMGLLGAAAGDRRSPAAASPDPPPAPRAPHGVARVPLVRAAARRAQ